MKTRIAISLLTLTCCVIPFLAGQMKKIGREVAIPRHLQDGEEFQISTRDLVSFGQKLFTAMWTSQEGAGRPLTKGRGTRFQIPQVPSCSHAISTASPGRTRTPARVATINPTLAAAVTLLAMCSFWGNASTSPRLMPSIPFQLAAEWTNWVSRSCCKPSQIRVRPSACLGLGTSK